MTDAGRERARTEAEKAAREITEICVCGTNAALPSKIKQMADIIERAGGKTAWVSVETKTPDHNDEYLVFNGYDKLVVTADFYEGRWMTVRTFGYSGSPDDITHHVTHWAALPSPPSLTQNSSS